MSVLNLFYANAKHCLVILPFLCSLENPTVAPSSGRFLSVLRPKRFVLRGEYF